MTKLFICLTAFALSSNGSAVSSTETILQTSNEACDTWRFEAPLGKFKGRERDWITKVTSFAYSSKRPYFFVVESRAPNPVTEKEMQTLLKDDRFAIWAGPHVVATAHDLIDKRRALEANQHKKPESTSDKRTFQNRDRKIGVQYKNARDKYIGALLNRFQLTRIDMSEHCDD